MGAVHKHAHPASLHGSSGDRRMLPSSAEAAAMCLAMHCGENMLAANALPYQSHLDGPVRNSCDVGAWSENLIALVPAPAPGLVPGCSTSWKELVGCVRCGWMEVLMLTEKDWPKVGFPCGL